MTPEQIQQFLDLLDAEMVPPDKLSDRYEYQRAWNDGIKFSKTNFLRIVGEKKNDA